MPGPKTVLYVEDNEANLALVRKVLEARGEYEVHGAETAEAGLESLEQRIPAVILLDLDLPDMNGIEFARRVKSNQARRAIPIIAISASVMKRERLDALGAGCVAFVEKPFDIGELRTVVREAIEGKTAGQGQDPDQDPDQG